MKIYRKNIKGVSLLGPIIYMIFVVSIIIGMVKLSQYMFW